MDITVRIKDNPENRIELYEYDHDGIPWYELSVREGDTIFELRCTREQIEALHDALISKLDAHDLVQPEDMVNTDGAYLKLVLVRPGNHRG